MCAVAGITGVKPVCVPSPGLRGEKGFQMNDQEFQTTALEDMIPASAEDVTPAAQPEPQPTPEPEQPSSEPTGVKPEEPASPAEAAPNETRDPVPFEAYENERKGRQEAQEYAQRIERTLQEQLAQQQQLQPPPQAELEQSDELWWNDPEAAAKTLEQRFDEKVQAIEAKYQADLAETRVLNSEQFMRTQHQDYDETVQVFENAVKQMNPQQGFALVSQMMSSPNPAQFAYQTAKQMQTMQAVGTDEAAYREKVRQEILAEMKNQTVQPAVSAPVPTSLASAPNAPPASQSGGWDGPKPLSAIIGE